MPMPNERFYQMVEAIFSSCLDVMRSKGTDYTRGSDNKLDNFERHAAKHGMNPLAIITLYQDKHRDAIDAYCFRGELESDEALEMRFVDEINYDLLKLAQAIANGYEPQTKWLKAAMSQASPGETGDRGAAAEEEKETPPPQPAPEEPKGGSGKEVEAKVVGKGDGETAVEACCNPGGKDCCDGD